MDKEYNDDVYLEPAVELGLDDPAALAGQQPQEIKVQICTTGC